MSIRIRCGEIYCIFHIDAATNDSDLISPVSGTGHPSKVTLFCLDVRYIFQGQICDGVIVEIAGFGSYSHLLSILHGDVVDDHIGTGSEEVLEIEEIAVSG